MARRRFGRLTFLAALVAGSLPASGASQGSGTQPVPRAEAPPAAGPSSAAAAGPSEAERIAALDRILNADRARRSALQEELARLASEFERASEEFGGIDSRHATARAALEAAAPGERAEREQVVASLGAERAAARDRFDLVIRRRKAARQQLDALDEKISLEEETLEQFSNPDAAGEDTSDPQASGEAGAVDPRRTNRAVSPLSIPGLPTAAAADASAADGADPEAPTAGAADVPADERVQEARRELAARQDEMRAARRDLDLLDRGVDVFERDLAALQESLAAAKEEAQRHEEAVQTLRARTAAAGPDGPPDQAESLRRERDEADRLLGDARREVARLSEQAGETRTQLDRLRARRPEVVKLAEDAQAAVAAAGERLEFLESPLAPHRLWRWLRDAGPRILVVAAGMAAAWWFARVVGRRVVANLVRRSRRGSQAEREGRAETLRRVFQNAAGLAILAVGLLAALDQAGIDVTVLLGGAAVIGAAVAFGAQNLIKDYFTGFMILVENQYSVGNVVRLGGLSGSVEDISLRTTVLRDEEGAVHFVPHGQITTVSNLTHGWSRAVFAIPIGYGEDVDRVMEVLLDLARELRDDPEFGPKTLGEPEMQGVEALGDSAVVVKFLVKTRPLQQWSVKRELLRRIKKRFDRLGIEIPFPHQTVLYREIGLEEADASPPTAGAGAAGALRESDGRSRGGG